MTKEDKTVAAIMFGIILVLLIKTIETIIPYFFADFAASNQYLITFIAGAGGASVALLIVRWFFPNFGKWS